MIAFLLLREVRSVAPAFRPAALVLRLAAPVLHTNNELRNGRTSQASIIIGTTQHAQQIGDPELPIVRGPIIGEVTKTF